MKEKIKTIFLISATIIAVVIFYLYFASKWTLEEKILFITIFIILPGLVLIIPKMPASFSILWKFLGFIIVCWLLSLSIGWAGAFSSTVVLFSIFYYIYNQGIKEGEKMRENKLIGQDGGLDRGVGK